MLSFTLQRVISCNYFYQPQQRTIFQEIPQIQESEFRKKLKSPLPIPENFYLFVFNFFSFSKLLVMTACSSRSCNDTE